MSVTGLLGRDQGGGRQSQDSRGWGCPKGNEDPGMGFKQLSDRIICTFRQINKAAV